VKNQYFGDINDYRKYGLLRTLTGFGRVSTVICWMLTPDDGGSDGKFIRYLNRSSKWRDFDPALFDKLRDLVVVEGVRDVRSAARARLLPNAKFFTAVLPDDSEGRRQYFDSFRLQASASDLVFFDPDNGMEVRSRKKGRKCSSKYLYWSELTDAYSRHKSVMVYQHFRRSRRDLFISVMTHEISETTGATEVYSFGTAHAVYFLLLHDSTPAILKSGIALVRENWRDQILVSKHASMRVAGKSACAVNL
jgi:hypothetical protein